MPFPLGVVGEEARAAAPVQRQDLRGNGVQHVPVVRHQHQRAGELRQAVFQHLQGRDVQVVGRLIQDQQVGGLEHQAGDQDPRLLAAGEAGQGPIELVGGEQKALGPAGDVNGVSLVHHRLAVGGQRLAQRHRRVQMLPVLIEQDHAQAVGALDRPGVGRTFARQQPEQRRLAAAVRAEQAQAHPGRERQVQSENSVRPPGAAAMSLATSRSRVCRPDALNAMPAVLP